jgi:hypothetical protein
MIDGIDIGLEEIFRNDIEAIQVKANRFTGGELQVLGWNC